MGMHFVFGEEWMDRDEPPNVRLSRNIRLYAPEKFGCSAWNRSCYDGLVTQQMLGFAKMSEHRHLESINPNKVHHYH